MSASDTHRWPPCPTLAACSRDYCSTDCVCPPCSCPRCLARNLIARRPPLPALSVTTALTLFDD